MLKKENQGIVWLEFEKLQKHPQIRHAIFTKKAKVTHSFDLGYTVDDEGQKTRQNRLSAYECIGMNEPISCIYSRQVHGKEVHIAKNCTPRSKERFVFGYDAFATCSPNLALCIQHADCQSALFFDPKKNCIANVHCGWRGSVQNIYKTTIDTLAHTYGSSPEDLIVCISPSLGPECAEFIHYKTELPKEFWPFQPKPTYFDFWQISRWQLESCGILAENIEIASMCTHALDDLFFSYRRTRESERHVSLIWLDLPDLEL